MLKRELGYLTMRMEKYFCLMRITGQISTHDLLEAFRGAILLNYSYYSGALMIAKEIRKSKHTITKYQQNTKEICKRWKKGQKI